MNLFIVEKSPLGPADLAALGRLEKRAMGESGVDPFTLQPLACHGKLFTLETSFARQPGRNRDRLAGRFELAVTGGGRAVPTGKRRILGAAEFMRSFSKEGLAHLFGFYVDEPLRGTGAARALLSAAENALAEKFGIFAVDLTVARENGRAVAFYKKCGYRVSSFKRDYYGSGRHRLVMKKNIGPGSSR